MQNGEGFMQKKSSAADSLSSALIIPRVRPFATLFLFILHDWYIQGGEGRLERRDEIQHLAFSLFAQR